MCEFIEDDDLSLLLAALLLEIVVIWYLSSRLTHMSSGSVLAAKTISMPASPIPLHFPDLPNLSFVQFCYMSDKILLASDLIVPNAPASVHGSFH